MPNPPTPATLYDQIGGEASVRALVSKFYDLMDTLPEASGIRALHPKDLRGSREKLFMFLSGWLGGPSLYIEKFGHPRLRARHLPFPIGGSERDQWMLCMTEAMKALNLDANLQLTLRNAFAQTADFMRNKTE
jgi:hemoglobin